MLETFKDQLDLLDLLAQHLQFQDLRDLQVALVLKEHLSMFEEVLQLLKIFHRQAMLETTHLLLTQMVICMSGVALRGAALVKLLVQLVPQVQQVQQEILVQKVRTMFQLMELVFLQKLILV